jgi:GT2 family glycosyltransferase
MEKDQNKNFLIKLQKILRLHNLYNALKKIYFSIFPKGSKFYNFTYGFLRIFLRKIHLFNIYYYEWIRHNDTIDEKKFSEINEAIELFEHKPRFSIVMPVYNPPIKLLESAILSVINQVYSYWELCIADDASTNPDVISLLESYTQQDKRIKVVFREENGHISAASNSALALANYEFIVLLDHDDVLHPLALYFTSQTILANPDCQIIYSDEDKITKRGRRLDAYFKPDFDYHLLLSHNMISHLGVYRTATVRKVGGFRLGLEGSQDYDLLLRVYEEIKPDQIHHIPFPLYHWRISKKSAAEDVNIKPYAIEAGKKALKDHLNRQSIQAQVTFLPELASYQIDYDLPKTKPGVTILIRDQEFTESLKNCVDSLLENTDYPNYSIVLSLPQSAKNSAVLPSRQWEQKVKIEFIQEEIFNTYAGTLNEAVSRFSDDYVLFLERTTVVKSRGWLSNLVAQANQEKIGAVGPKILYKNNLIYSGGIILLSNGDIQHMFNSKENTDDGYFGWAKITRGYSALSEKCLLVKRENFNTVGGITTSLKTPTYSIVDFCLKLKSIGLRNVYRPSVELYLQENFHHNMPDEFSKLETEGDRLYLLNNWEEWVKKDPGFNPNLKIFDDGKLLVELSPEIDFPGV